METITQPFALETINPSELPELQGLKEKQLKLVEANPFVHIQDAKSYDEAKKARTNLLTGRTDIEKQDKVIAGKIKKFREMVAGISADLISITRPHEEKQQEEVKRWEAIKEAEKAEKQRLEEERINTIKAAINDLIGNAVARIESLTFADLNALKEDFEENLYKTDVAQFEEFELDFNERLQFVKSQLAAKEKQLNEIEAQRLENLRLEEERKKLEAERAELERLKKEAEAKAEADAKALKEKQASDEARIAKEKDEAEAKLAAEKKAIADQQKAAQDKLDKERKELEDEKARIAQAEADKKAKEEADRLAAEKAEADRIQAEKDEEEKRLKAERAEALKPEKEKAIDFLKSLEFKNKFPAINDTEITDLLEAFCRQIDIQQNELVKTIINL